MRPDLLQCLSRYVLRVRVKQRNTSSRFRGGLELQNAKLILFICVPSELLTILRSSLVFKSSSQLFLLIITSTTLLNAYGDAGIAQQGGSVASQLFGIAYSSIDDACLGANYKYNNWKDSPEIHKQGECDAYDGGHSGIDIQTKDVVGGCKCVNRAFYSVTKGKVINAGGDKYNTIAIYDQQQDITSIYLHARQVDVSLGQGINVGQQLGIQGDKGITGKVHVHFEVRKGKHTSYACGASDPTSLDPIQIANNYINSRLKTFDGEWHSPTYNYSFLINGDNGVATLSNSQKYQVGDNMLKIGQVSGNSFSGFQIYTDGNWYPISGIIDSNGVMRLQGGGFSWDMIKK